MAWPLIYTETAYGETNANALRPRTEPPPPLEFNIGSDLQGRVLLGGIAVNTATGSRVALLGDSEIVQNLYGLARVSEGSNVPRYPGDRVLVERLAAWLMGLPEESWPGLPEGITWIALDGDASDWPQGGPVTNDEILDAPYNDIQSVQAFSNDQYVYVLIEAHDIVDEPRLELRMRDGNQVRDIIYSQGIFAMVNQDLQTTPLTDAAIAIGQVIELRLPRRALGQANRFEDLCIGTLNLPNMDCAGAPVQIRLTNDIDPVPLRSRGLPSAYVINNANLRTGPSTTTAGPGHAVGAHTADSAGTQRGRRLGAGAEWALGRLDERPTAANEHRSQHPARGSQPLSPTI